jgi:acyl carrier protein
MTTDIYSRIKQVLATQAELNQDASKLDLDDDLFAAGMSSRATVGVMLGLESEFDIEFPDAMLRREVFESVRAIGTALGSLGA